MTDLLNRLRSLHVACYAIERVRVVGTISFLLSCGGEPAGPDDGPSYRTLAITTTSLPHAVATVPYDATLVAVGGDSLYMWSVADGALPIGLHLNGSTGLVSGTASARDSKTFTAQVVSGDGQTATQQLTITVELPVLEPDERCGDYPHAIVTFEDPTLESTVREALSSGAEESLTCAMVPGLAKLWATSRGISSLVGMQNLTGLQVFYAYENSISDLNPLRGLTRLWELHLDWNSISDINALGGLTSLEWLDLYDNAISDINALGGLTNLEWLYLDENAITDISALSGLTSLFRLSLSGNPVRDLGPLSGLTNLTDLSLDRTSIADISALGRLTTLVNLYLSNNEITNIEALRGLTNLSSLDLHGNSDLTDIEPLLDNPGIGAGDRVSLWGTSVSCADVLALQAKGVGVWIPNCP